MDSPVLTVQDPLAAAGELVVDCRPPLLPVSMDISGVDVSVIRASAVSAETAAFPPEREQSFGGGGDLRLSLVLHRRWISRIQMGGRNGSHGLRDTAWPRSCTRTMKKYR